MIIILAFSTEQELNRFEYLFDKYKKLLLYKANNILRDYSLAEDATSEAFIRVYKNIHKIDDVDSNQTISFLVTIVTNVAITMLNKEKKRNIVSVDFEENFSNQGDDFNLEDHIVSKSSTSEMLACVEELKEELKAPFLLKYAHELSHREIGEVLGISENNVTVRIHRAKAKLATILRKEGHVSSITRS
jgi:RNA polymerase sigma-70 factor (ECF subfamily)